MMASYDGKMTWVMPLRVIKCYGVSCMVHDVLYWIWCMPSRALSLSSNVNGNKSS